MTMLRIEFSFTVHWCPRHLEPFRAGWPHGAAVAMVELLHAALAMPAVADACRVLPDGTHDADDLDVALRRFAPLCCFIPPEQREAIYVKAGVK